MTTIETITRAQVEALMSEAVAAGDDAQVRLCRKALVSIDHGPIGVPYPDSDALRECVRAIRAAEACEGQP